MEHKTNYWALLLLAIILWGVVYFVRKESVVEIEIPVINFVNNDISVSQNLATTKIGSLQLSYPNLIKIDTNSGNNAVRFVLGGSFKSLDNFGEAINTTSMPIAITYLPNGNPTKLSLGDWWQEEDPNNYPHLTGPDVVEKIKINNMDAYKVVYTHVTGVKDDTYWYSDVSIFIIRDTEVYELKGYILAEENPDFRFTAEDIKSTRQYEQIFNQILASFKFVD